MFTFPFVFENLFFNITGSLRHYTGIIKRNRPRGSRCLSSPTSISSFFPSGTNWECLRGRKPKILKRRKVADKGVLRGSEHPNKVKKWNGQNEREGFEVLIDRQERLLMYRGLNTEPKPQRNKGHIPLFTLHLITNNIYLFYKRTVTLYRQTL